MTCRSARDIVLLAAWGLFFLTGSSIAQGLELLEKGFSTLREKERDLELSTPRKPEEMVPLEGRIDRSVYRLGPGDEVDVSIWGGRGIPSLPPLCLG